MEREEKVRVCVTLPSAICAEMQDNAKRLGVPVSTQLEEIVKGYFKRARKALA